MPVHKVVDIDLAVADLDGIAAANVTVAATGVVLDGVLTSGGSFTSADGLGRIITIKDAGSDDQSAAVFTLVGTDANNQAITEAITGPGIGATVVSTKFYKTLTAVNLSGTVDDTDVVDIGTRGTTLSARSLAVPLEYGNRTAATIALEVTGTCSVNLLETFDYLLDSTTSIDNALWFESQASKTASQSSQLSVGATGVMLEVDTYSSGAEIQMTIIQPRN